MTTTTIIHRMMSNKNNNKHSKKNLLSTITLFLLILTLLSTTVHSINFFPPSFSAAPNFQKSKLYDATKELNLGGIQGRAACLADVNYDKYTDLVVIGCQNQCIQMFLWTHSTWQFKVNDNAQINAPSNADNYTLIEDVTAADLNFDGKLDLLVTVRTYRVDTKQVFPGYQLIAYMGLGGSSAKFSNVTQLPYDFDDQVLVMDINGDMRVDLFGEMNGKRTFWINQAPKKGEEQQALVYEVVQQEADDEQPLYPLVYPATNVFIDLNGDCSSDLFVTSCMDENYSATSRAVCTNQLFEIWVSSEGKLKRQNRVFKAPIGSGRVVFNDFDRDGDFDLIVPVCNPRPYCDDTNEVVIYMNDQPSRSMTDLCSRKNFTMGSKTYHVQFPADKRLAQTFQQADGSYFPATMRAGDYNFDGYTDLVVPVIQVADLAEGDDTNGRRIQSLKLMLWTNIACPSKSPENCVRTFHEQLDGVDDLPLIDVPDTDFTPIYNGFFMDLDESGVLDILTTMYDHQSGNQTIRGYYNNYFNDAYFLKTHGLNGAKERGTQMPGMTFKFSVSDLQGKKHPRINTQLTQSSYAALQPPYHLFGLGRTNGYVEDFFFGKVFDSSKTNYQYQTGIIPNSQLVALPYPTYTPSKWELELYVSPSGHSFWVAISVLSTLVLIGLPIIALWRYEKYKDKKAKTSSTEAAHSAPNKLLIG